MLTDILRAHMISQEAFEAEGSGAGEKHIILGMEEQLHSMFSKKVHHKLNNINNKKHEKKRTER